MSKSPQIEDGYTRLANELLDAIIQYPFSSREYSIVMAIIRATYGYNKKEDAISGWQLSEMTGIDRSHVSKTIAELIAKNIIIKSDRCRISHGQQVPSLALNKDYKLWSTVAKKATVKTVAELATPTVADSATVAKTAPVPKQPHTVAKTAIDTVAELATPPLPKQPTHKDIPKDNTKDIPKDNSAPDKSGAFSQVDLLLAEGVEKQAALDWLKVRKAKRAGDVTKTVINGLRRESSMAGMTVDEAVKKSCEMGWQGFSASWVTKISPASKSRHVGFEQINYREGVAADGSF